MVKNGWHYKVWGASDDPTTWLEQNISLLEQGQTPPQRKLKRREVFKPEDLVVDEVKKSKDLTLSQGQPFVDFALQISDGIGYTVIGLRD